MGGVEVEREIFGVVHAVGCGADHEVAVVLDVDVDGFACPVDHAVVAGYLYRCLGHRRAEHADVQVDLITVV